ncbi:marine proteobacterial sortase target protein [Zooshikella harenae]|uniref:Marine proteobacterial sortase target protein n=1 Tax=Zooshikella harenae TaxID=2827238 RepID=A0ABS5Z828_9GAMM|nr:marine proteobacterial sortase target protein [Zooshikella harenae]MBU2710159.1 marine proteobacterial sortase target protein [Zooshikella harenae]
MKDDFAALNQYLGWLAIGLWLFCFLSLLGFSAAKASTTNHYHEIYQSPEEVTSGSLLLKNKTTYINALRLDNHVNIDVNGIIAAVTVTQRFKNSGSEWAEGVYAFPLPENAAVYAMEMTIGNRTIKGLIKRKEEAKHIYTTAKAAGQQASLLSQDRPNLFTTQVANIAPEETIEVKISYMQSVPYISNQYQLRFPMTITPRYKSAQTTKTDTNFLSSPQTSSLPPLPQRPAPQTPLKVDLTININAGLPLVSLNSSTHKLKINKNDHQYIVQLKNDAVIFDRDLELTWQPQTAFQPQATFFTEEVHNETYGLLMVAPPKMKKNKTPLSKEQIFIIDTSGSMAGSSIVQAKTALQFALRQLNPNDRFNIIAFDSTTRTLFERSQRVSMLSMADAIKFIDDLAANGGTEILPALQAAVTLPLTDVELSQIIFITDGSVGNEVEILQFIHQNLAPRRLFTIGIGSAPNSYFMRKSAEFGRGTFTYVPHMNTVEQRITHLFNQIQNPIASGITVTWPDGQQQTISDLYQGQPLIITKKLESLKSSLVIKAKMGRQPWEQVIPQTQLHQPANGIGKLWARQQIEMLQDEYIQTNNSELPEQITQIALTHQLASRYTSFVAVAEQIVKPAHQQTQSTNISNALPHGNAYQTTGFPQTATTAPWHLLMAFISALLGLLCLCWSTMRKHHEI